MDVVSAIAIYFIIWWLIFFPVLAIGNRDPDTEETRVAGADRGAPAHSRLGRRVLLTTLAAAVVFAGVLAVLNSGLTLEDIPLPSPPGL
ncbi:DUF1467 family protein [Acuticoccus sp.]|uniref:DUF1467 family protein n=1 Tax=Acuticoccus sp. TaxID=1904378 RepID=UPI003B52DDD2